MAYHTGSSEARPDGPPHGVGDLRPGDHLCLLYRDDEEQRAVLAEYARRGVERGERVLCIVDARNARRLRRDLREAGIEVREVEARGQLQFLTGDTAYRRDGAFDPQGMISLLRQETEKAQSEGFAGLRVTGEMAWALRGLPGSERLIEYEALLNEFFPGSTCTGLCQYDAREFPPEILLDVLRTHPVVAVGRAIHGNPFYIPPRVLLNGESDRATLDRWLATLAERSSALSALQDHARQLEERVKELDCRKRVRELVMRDDLGLPEILQASGDLIRSGWRWPELARVRVELDGVAYGDADFPVTCWRQSAPLRRGGKVVGVVEVAYPDPPPQPAPFLAEEQDLLNGIAHLLSRTIELRHSQERILHLNAVLRAIRNVNQLIVRERDAGRLLQRACELLAETRGVACAWIALLDVGGRPVRWTGNASPEAMGELVAAWNAGSPPFCVRQALTGSDPVVVQNPNSACPSCPVARQYGPSSGVAVRLEHEGHVHGVLVVGVPAPLALDAEELELIKEVAGDLALALHIDRMEDRLRELGRRYREVFEHSQDGFVMVDPAGRIVDANPAYCAMLGYTLDELRSLPDFYAITPEKWHAWERTEIWEKRLLGGGESGVYEKEYIRKDGTVFPVELRSFAVRDEAGSIAYLWAVVRDVSERTRSEEKMSRLVHQLTILHRVGQEISRTATNPEQIYTVIHKAVADLMPAEAFVISLRTGENEAEAVYLVDEGGRYPPERVPYGEGLTWEVLTTQRTVHISDVAQGVSFKARRFGKKKSVRSIIAVPLRTGKRTLGMISTQSYRPGAFSEDDVHILEMFASHAAVALENSQLVISLREREDGFRNLAEELRQSEEKYRTLVRHLPAIVYTVELGEVNRTTYISPQVEALLGYSPEEWLADPGLWADRVHPEDRERVLAEVRQRDAAGEPLDLEYRVVARDGSVRWFRNVTSHVEGANGGRPYSHGVMLDITGRKRAEEELQKAKEKYRSLFHQISAGVYLHDLEGRILEVNEAACAMLGYTRDELLQRSVFDLHSDVPGTVNMPREEVLRAWSEWRLGERHVVEAEHCRKDGHVVPVEVLTGVVEYGGARRVLAIVTDITNRKQVEADLIAEKEWSETVIQNAPSIIVGLGDDARILIFNRYVEELTGYSAREVLGKDWIEIFIPPELQGELRGVWNEIVAGKPVQHRYENPILTKTGERRLIRWSNTVLTDRGKFKMVLSLGEDVTEQRRAEAELRASYQTIRRMFDDVVNTLASTIELRDPYTAGHQRRVAELAVALGGELGLSSDEQSGLHLAGLVHDVGKIVVPSEILSKPGPLSDLEMYLVRAHPEAGFDVLRRIEFPWPVAEMVRQHHERLDGSGYPRGLRGEEILLGARILAVADVVEAISSHRPYRPALGIKVALAEIEDGKGRLYDPQVVAACVSLFRKGFAFSATDGSPSR